MKHKPKKTLSVIVNSTVVWVCVSLLVLPYAVLALLLYTVNVRTRHKILSTWGRIFNFLVKHLCKVNYVVKGIEHLPQTPSIIASNHQSAWETFAYVAIFPQHVWILKRELIRIPIFGWALSTVYPIAIDRNKKIAATQQILKQSVSRIKKGFWILVFPEGTRVTPGVVRPFKVGVAKMAKHLKIAIVPVTHNAGFCMPKSSFLIYPGTIEVIIDKPLLPKIEESAEELTLRIEKVVRDNMRHLSR